MTPIPRFPDYPLTPLNTLGVQAHARWYVPIPDLATLRAALAHPEWQGMPRLILGGGSNILLTGDFPGVVLHVQLPGKHILQADDSGWLIQAGAGESWHGLVTWTLDQGMHGLENLALIPGTVGAAPVQNIGAYGVELKDCLAQVHALEIATGEMCVLTNEDCAFAYRDSIFKGSARDRYVITSVTLRLPRQQGLRLDYGELRQELAARGVTQPTARDVADAVIAIRQRKLPDPAVIGNAGSFFKNPLVDAAQAARLTASHPNMPSYPQANGQVKLAAGWLIEQCGWKGRRDGAAGMYERQALVLVNHGSASGAELWRVARQVQADVMARFGVALEAEPIVVPSPPPP